MNDTDNEYREQLRRKRRARTIRNIAVSAVLVLILVGLFVIKFTRENGIPDSATVISETTEEQ